MKKLKFKMHGNLRYLAFPDHLLKNRRELLLILLEACRFMQQNSIVDHADNLLLLVVNDMSRLFFCVGKKMYSISFPFQVHCYPMVHFDFDNVDIDSCMISNLCTFLNSKDYDERSILDFATPILEQEELFSKDFWKVLKHLLTYEIGYVRYDDDIEGFKSAANAGKPDLHPRFHYDVNLTQQSAFKIGLDKQMTLNKFVDFLDDTKTRKTIKV